MSEPESGLRQQILETANDLFVRKGYHGMSMREISDALGVSKAALYYHFQDKEELFLAILEAYLDAMSSALDAIIARPVSCKAQITLFVEYVLTQPAARRATIRLASQELAQLSPEARRRFGIAYRQKFIDKAGSILQRGMKAGEFRKINPEVAVWALLGIMYPYFYPGHSESAAVPAETIREVVKIFLGGIS
jgi:AcrR family transcriptional regulator